MKWTHKVKIAKDNGKTEEFGCIPVTIAGRSMAVHDSPCAMIGYTVTDCYTGMRVEEGETRYEAISNARKIMARTTIDEERNQRLLTENGFTGPLNPDSLPEYDTGKTP